MKTQFAIFAAFLALGASSAMAQDAPRQSRAPAPQGINGKTIESCQADIQKSCSKSASAVQQECLVLHWKSLSDDCQDALIRPDTAGGD